MNLYRIKCYVSTKDWGDVAETMVFNKYGTKTALFHWTDLTAYKPWNHAFLAHNFYFTWGEIYQHYHLDNFIDKMVNIGCIFKAAYNRELENRDKIISRIASFKKDKKAVLFCDTSFSNSSHYTERFFIEYLSMVKEFCEKNNETNAMFKPKNYEKDILQLLEFNKEDYKKIKKSLLSLGNFNYLDPSKWSLEEALAISDVCVSMAMNTASTIALIFGKNALYFDTTGNVHHPFAVKYKNILVFDDKILLFRQIENILAGKFDCRSTINERELREYDAFDDDRAIERLKNNLYEIAASTH